MDGKNEEAPVAVVGATGMLGRAIVRNLAAGGARVRALVRKSANPTRMDELRRAGAEFVEGDLGHGDALAALCKGARAVVSTASSTLSRQSGDTIESVDRDGQIRLVEAAERASVERYVFVSFYPFADGSPLQAAKRAVEERLEQSRLSYTILRPTFFMDVWLSPAVGFDAANRRAVIFGPGTRPISWIALEDVARFAVGALDSEGARGKRLDLGGPEALTPLEVVRLVEELRGGRMQIEHVPEEALGEAFAAATDPLERSFAALKLGYARGQVVDVAAALAAVPLHLTTVREHVERNF